MQDTSPPKSVLQKTADIPSKDHWFLIHLLAEDLYTTAHYTIKTSDANYGTSMSIARMSKSQKPNDSL